MKSDLKRKTIVITGGSSGIGAAAAKVLRENGAAVIITGRSPQTRIIAEATGCDYYLVDYARFSDVRQFAQVLLDKYPRIDVLVNNAGAVVAKRQLTPDGHEMTLQVNHLSGFLLTNLLRSRLEESNAVVINTSSGAHMYGHIDFNDLGYEKGYNVLRAYANSKMMNILHAMEISRRFRGVSAASFHPGGVATGVARGNKGIMKLIYETPLKHILLVPPSKGADTLLWLINGEPGNDWQPGEYYYKRKPYRRNTQITASAAKQLWEISERMVNEL